MASITLKQLPGALHRALRKRAKANHRSLNQEVIATLRAATARASVVDTAAFDEQARRARALFHRPVTDHQVKHWKRPGRL
jgi:plasmid stability protein